MAEIILQTDGGSRGNPGIAGAGAVILDKNGTVLKSASKALGTMTNNEAEYQALIFGLATVKKHFGKTRLAGLALEVRMDSELVVKQLNGEYQIKEENLWPCFIKIWNARVADFRRISFIYVPREQNSLADKLANQAMDGAASSTLFS